MSDSTRNALAAMMFNMAERWEIMLDAIDAGDLVCEDPAGCDHDAINAADEWEESHTIDPCDYLMDEALELVDERGREFAVVFTTGGPHIELAADGLQTARLDGYWAGERVTLYRGFFDRVLEMFIER